MIYTSLKYKDKKINIAPKGSKGDILSKDFIKHLLHFNPISMYFITRYDYNLTIMKSPKPATDNRFKK